MFYFRRRTNKTSYDTYDCLTTSHTPPHNQRTTNNQNNSSSLSSEYDSSSQFMNQDEYWTNGTTLQFFNVASSSNTIIENTPYKVHSTTRMMKAINDESSSSNKNHLVQQHEHHGIHESHRIDETTNKKRNNRSNEVRNSIMAGSLAGITSCSIFHPFDVVRTKMQASTKIVPTNSATMNSAAAAVINGGNASSPKTAILRNGINASSGPLAVIAHTYKNGGIRAFYTGIGLPLAAQALYKSTVLTTNRISMNVVTEWRTKEQRKTGIFTKYKLTSFDHFICGSISGAVNAILFVCPVEYVRNQLIQEHTKKAEGHMSGSGATMKGPIDVVKKTLQNEGVLGLWRGAGVTLVRDSIGCGAFFIMNDFGKRYISHNTGYNESALVNKLGSGFLAGFGYWFVSLPADALKTLVQTGKATSAWDTLSMLIARDGIVGATRQLYHGWQLAFGRGSPSAAITLTTYSIAYNFCERKSA